MDEQPGPVGSQGLPRLPSPAGQETAGQGPPAAAGEELALLRAAVEGGLDGMVVVSSDGVMVASNQRFADIWPIPAEVVGSGSDDAALASVLDKLVDPDAFLARVQQLYGTASGSARDELLLLDGRVLDPPRSATGTAATSAGPGTSGTSRANGRPRWTPSGWAR